MPIYRLPRRFYEDHVSRGLAGGTLRHGTKAHLWVELADADHADLLSDAEHYANPDAGLAADHPGLASSARATLLGLQAPAALPRGAKAPAAKCTICHRPLDGSATPWCLHPERHTAN